MKVLFSYTRDDTAFALQLAFDLRESGADVWIDQLDIRPGGRSARGRRACPDTLTG